MKLSAIVLTHNEELMLSNCLECLSWADEIVVVDKRSTDDTLTVAKKYKAKIVVFDGDNFDAWRNVGKDSVTGDWIIYIDPDERVTPALKEEITKALENPTYSAYKMPRKNYWWGKEFTNCGASPDYVTRLFNKSKLKQWIGIIHESPVVEDEVGTLINPLIHLTHRDLISGLQKSYQWTHMEAQLFFEANHPKATWWRLAKVSMSAFFKKYISEKGYREGTAGFIESCVQAWNRFMVYEQLWEMQQNPLLEAKYFLIDKEVSNKQS
jgi:glycosyltransferase involved in cell wall biosynthesis